MTDHKKDYGITGPELSDPKDWPEGAIGIKWTKIGEPLEFFWDEDE